jgi:hypothetical protein
MNPPERRPHFAWPGKPHLARTRLLTILVAAWFGIVFVGANWITAHRLTRVRVHLDAELDIPFVPAFTVVYMSIYLLFAAAPFVLRTPREITRLAAAQTITISLAGIGFLLIPAQLAYAPPTNAQLGLWKPLFVFADRLNLDYNLVPSLHIALAVVCVEMFVVHAGTAGKILWRSWAGLIAASTLLTHQHHVVDAVTGYLLALAVVKWMSRFEHQK